MARIRVFKNSLGGWVVECYGQNGQRDGVYPTWKDAMKAAEWPPHVLFKFPCGCVRPFAYAVTNGIVRCPKCNRVWFMQDGRFTYEGGWPSEGGGRVIESSNSTTAP